MIIGITGGIGSGKSTIAQELAKRGFTVYDCDREAKRIIAEDKHVQAQIIALLGEEAFSAGRYNTAYVARRVFAEPKMLKALNAIIHPAVIADIRRLTTKEAMTGSLFLESAILYQAGLDTLCDKVVIIDAPEEVRIARVIARDYDGCFTPENTAKVRARIQAQLLKTEDIRQKTLTLLNDGTTPVPELVDTLLARIA